MISAKASALVLLASLAGCRSPSPAAQESSVDVGPIQSFEGESAPGAWGFGSVPDAPASNGQAMEFYTTVAVTYRVEVIRVASGLVARAKGDDCKGPPTMQIDVDGRTVLTTEVKSHRWADYQATVPLDLGMHSFTVRFLDDHYEPPSCDRNLYLDKITLVNAHPPNDGDVEAAVLLFPSGSMLVDDAQAGHKHALGFMSSGAAVGQTNLRVPTGEIVVRARADECHGPPLLVVSVDGVERLSTPVLSTTWQEYRAKTALREGLHTLSVEFPNDHYEPPCDRNLYVDTIRFLPAAQPSPP